MDRLNEIGEIIKGVIDTTKQFIDSLDPELVKGILASLIATVIVGVIAFSFKTFKKTFLFLYNILFIRISYKKRKNKTIKIEGTTTINKSFIAEVEAIGKKQKYNADDFYLAKQYEYSQWYGILNNWDIERDAYKRIREEVKDSFTDEFRQARIVALILGRGGTGKSTLMRRLAIDSVKEKFCVLWISDKEITKFYEKGISQLSNYSNTSFLILIEDWYRIRENTENAKEIINNICNYPNVRVVLGDRTIDKSISKEHIFNPDVNIIELLVSENKNTIEKILTKVPHWQKTAKTLLTKDNDYNSTLYLILWVIARTYQEESNGTNENKIKKEGLAGHFQTIVESDLKAISKHYSGLAKVLSYWGSAYSERKMHIGFDMFIKLADLFKKEEENSSQLAFASKEIRPVLDIYINKAKGMLKAAEELPVVAFNHDVLADEGLSKIQMDGWLRFDDTIKLQMLPVAVNQGDDFSASIFLNYTIHTLSPESISNDEKLKYIKILFEKGNRGSYLNMLFNNKVHINETEKNKYAIKILNEFSKKNEYQINTISHCLNQIKSLPSGEKAISDILSRKDLLELTSDIVITAIKISRNDNERQKAASIILSQPDFYKLPHSIVSTAMKISKNDDERQKAASVILSQPDLLKLPQSIVSTAMKISNNKNERQKAASVILSQPDFYKLPQSIVSTAMKISNNETERQKAASVILLQPDLLKLPFEIVSTVMKISNNETERQKAASAILSQPDVFKLPHQVVSTAMKITKNDDERQKAASAILSQPDFFRLSYQTVSTAMNISNNETERQKAVSAILSQPDFFRLSYQTVSTAMNISNNEIERQKAASAILSQPEFFRLSYQTVSTAMRISKNDDERQKAASAILSQPDFFRLPHQIVSAAIKISGNTDKAKYFLKDWKNTHWGIVFQSLHCFTKIIPCPQFVVNIINTIITSKSKDSIHFFHYSQILKIPFHEVLSWEMECNKIIKNYQRTNTSLINAVLQSHCSHPQKIKKVCETILKQWQTEITKPIKQLYGNPNFGDNIKIALGHPDLKTLAKQTAMEIEATEWTEPGTIPKYLLEITHFIVNENKFPEWASETVDF